MKPVRSLSREEVAALVCQALAGAGIDAVLSGGAVVSIYSENEYESFDLDFICLGLARRVDDTMLGLGFRKEGRHWVHPESKFWVEFPAGPVAVGDRAVSEFAMRRTSVGTLRLLAPTECVMDRLIAYYHWNDRQCLDQALAVARRHTIDLAKVEEWSRRERAPHKFEEFRERLAAPRVE